MRNSTPFLIALCCLLLCGCRGLQSEMQKSQHRKAGPTAVIGGTELKLVSELKRVSQAGQKGFDLTGRITVVAPSGSLPHGAEIYHFALKPGGAGYYVMNFTRKDNAWRLRGRYGVDPNFTGVSRADAGKHVIEFTWRNQGRGLGAKPEHFATCDVSVSVSDAQRKRHVLTQLSVSTD